MSHLRIIFVEWIDSQTEDGWSDAKVDGDLPTVYSAGIYLGETAEYIELSHSNDPANENACGRIKIPLSAIKKIRTLCQIQIRAK